MFCGRCEWFLAFIIFWGSETFALFLSIENWHVIVKICKMSLIYDLTLLLPVKQYNKDIQTAFNLLGAIIELEEKSKS